MRLRPIDELDLRWWVLEAPAHMGLRCGMGFQLERARAGQLFDMGGPGNQQMDRAVAAIRRANGIRARLRKMEPGQRTVLIAGYCWTRQIPGLDRLGPVALLTKSAAAAYQRAQDKAIAKSRGDRTDGLLESPLPRHVTLGGWLGPTLKANADLRGIVLAEADRSLTEACRKYYQGAARPCSPMSQNSGASTRSNAWGESK